MSHRKISAALSTHLSTLPSLPPVAWENAPFKPVSGTLYLRENYIPASVSAIGIENSSSDDANGIYQVSVFAELDKYKLIAQTVVDSIASHFARGTALLYESQCVRIETVDVSAALIGGGWYNIPISINWRSIS